MENRKGTPYLKIEVVCSPANLFLKYQTAFVTIRKMTMKRLSRFILVTFEANDAYGSKTQDKRQQSLKKGIENMQNKPHKYEQKQTYSGGENHDENCNT